jgi:hypothetical protein
MLSHLPSSQKKENQKFVGYEAAAIDSPLWRADWGIKQWIPYLLGTYCTLLYVLFAGLRGTYSAVC